MEFFFFSLFTNKNAYTSEARRDYVFIAYTRKAWCCVTQICLCGCTVFLGHLPFLYNEMKSNNLSRVVKDLVVG